MAADEFDKVELPAIEQLQSLGWEYVKGEDLSPDKSPERSFFKEVVLEKHLSNNIKRINPWISDQNLHKVVKDLTKTQYTNLIEANQAIWTILNECVAMKTNHIFCRSNKKIFGRSPKAFRDLTRVV